MAELFWPFPIRKPEYDWDEFDRDFISFMQAAFAEGFRPRTLSGSDAEAAKRRNFLTWANARPCRAGHAARSRRGASPIADSQAEPRNEGRKWLENCSQPLHTPRRALTMTCFPQRHERLPGIYAATACRPAATPQTANSAENPVLDGRHPSDCYPEGRRADRGPRLDPPLPR